MPQNRLPAPEQAYRALCTEGDQFADQSSFLDGLTYDHPKKGRTDIMVDDRVLSASGRTYADGDELNQALQNHNARTAPLSDAAELAGEYMAAHEVIWGFSGFATAGYDYQTEGRGMSELHDYLARTYQKPGLAVDGAARAGVLGLSGVIARRHNVPTLGFTPLQGLDSMAPRDHMVVKYDLYKQREVLVGALPDILVCVGGGDGTRRECQTALGFGSVVLMLALKEYGPSSLPGMYRDFSEMETALREDRLIVCQSQNEIPAKAEAALQASARTRDNARPARLSVLSSLLADGA